jgi:hypothetical protein
MPPTQVRFGDALADDLLKIADAFSPDLLALAAAEMPLCRFRQIPARILGRGRYFDRVLLRTRGSVKRRKTASAVGFRSQASGRVTEPSCVRLRCADAPRSPCMRLRRHLRPR